MVFYRKLKVAQSCPTLCNPMDYTVLQARILEWVAVPFPRGSSQPKDKPRSPALQVDSLPAEPRSASSKWVEYEKWPKTRHVLCMTHLKGNEASCTAPLVRESEFSKYSFPLQLQPPTSSSFFPLYFYFLQIFPFLMYKRSQFSNHPLFLAFRI